METSRRSFLIGATCALAAGPTIAKVGDGIATVNASYQTGSTLVVNPLPQAFELGDVITIDGVFALDRFDKTEKDYLRQFVVTAKAEPGMTSVFIYPPIVPLGWPHNGFATVAKLPMNRARLRKYAPAISYHEFPA